MKRSSKSTLSSRLNAGLHPGLPAPMQRIPFGQDSRCKELTGLTEMQLECAVALVAAGFTAMGPVTHQDVGDFVSSSAPSQHLSDLVKLGFAEVVGMVPGKTTRLYQATRKAWRELGFEGWSLLKEVA